MIVHHSMYNSKYLVKCLMGLGAMIVVMYATGGSGFAVAFFILFACFSRNNNELLLYTLVMTIAIVMGNGNIVKKGGVFAIEQRLLVLTLAALMIIRIAGSRKSPLLSSFLSLYLYILYMIIPSAAGWNPTISFLKIILFTMVFTAYYGVANSVINSERADTLKIRSVFLMMACFFIFGSVALLPFPSISQLSWEQMEMAIKAGQEVTSLFTGMTLHSQSLGPIISVLGILLFADMAFVIRKPDKLYVALLLCCPLLIWKTSSRTAMGSFVAGLMFTCFFFMRARGIQRSWKSKIVSVFMVVVIIISTSVILVPSLRENATNFILKTKTNGQEVVTFEEVTASRRGKWDEALYNFHKNPMIGNGFQVEEEMQGIDFSLTTMSAPVEKGVWVTAILEEGGVFGMIIFCLFLITTFTSLARHKCYIGLSMFFMLVLINCGEFTIFSMTSTGGLLWALVFIGVILDAKRIKDEKRYVRMGGVYAY